MTDSTSNGHSNGQTQGSGFLRFIGASVHRVEDQRILRGRGHYIDDLKLPGMLHAAFVRSPHAHARITRIDTSAAKALPGVVAVFTAPDIEAVTDPLANQPMPGHKSPPIYGLTGDKVRLVGDVVAIVVAESRYLAEDGCDLVEVDYEPLPAVSTIAQALDPERVRPSSTTWATTWPSTFRRPSATWTASSPRPTASSSTPSTSTATRTCQWRAAAAWPTTTPAPGNLTYHTANQAPQVFRMVLSHALRVPVHQLRVVNAQDIGGAFGSKAQVYREDLAILAGQQDPRTAGQMGRGSPREPDRVRPGARRRRHTSRRPSTNDGTLLGLTHRHGHEPGRLPDAAQRGQHVRLHGAHDAAGRRTASRRSASACAPSFSNKASYVPYRGPWAVETWVRERMLDIIARDLGLDPIDVRRRNLLDAGDLPTSMITGPDISQMTQRQTMDRALERIGYTRLPRGAAARAGRRASAGNRRRPT